MVSVYELNNLILNLQSNKDFVNKYEELIKLYPNEEDKIDLVFYDLYNFEYIKIDEKEKRQDSNYRKKVIEKYNTCMITGKPLKYSQVAHILPFTDSNEEEKYDHENGFLLCADIHIGFDSKELDFKINPDTSTFEVSSHILNDRSMEYYHQFNNKKLNLSEKNIYYLKKKYNYINHI